MRRGSCPKCGMALERNPGLREPAKIIYTCPIYFCSQGCRDSYTANYFYGDCDFCARSGCFAMVAARKASNLLFSVRPT